jgi:hypothetical protein
MNNLKNQLFFSHSWKNDNLGRNNHFRVYKIAKILQNLGYSIWIDEDNIKKLTSPKKLKHALYKPRWGSTGQLCDISI